VAFVSDPEFAVLRVLRVKGVCETDLVAVGAGMPADDATALLGLHLAGGLVLHREGRLPGWALSPAGRSADAKAATAELNASGAQPVIEAAYRGFLGFNEELLGLCTDWQLRVDAAGDQLLNDHSDAEHDATVIKRLGAVDDAVQPVCTDLAGALARFASYGPRLADARSRVEAGDTDWVAKPMIDSYHSVWFELHEDLLATLGIERGSEPVAAS